MQILRVLPFPVLFHLSASNDDGKPSHREERAPGDVEAARDVARDPPLWISKVSASMAAGRAAWRLPRSRVTEADLRTNRSEDV